MISDMKLGDCLFLMKGLKDKSIDCIITDPPYEVSPHGAGKKGLSDRSSKIRDEIEFMAHGFDYNAIFNEFLRVCKIPNFLIFCSQQQLATILSFFKEKKLKVDVLVWSKTNPCPLCWNNYISDIEYIVYVHDKGACFNNKAPLAYKKKTKRYSIITNKMNKLHPTQKPLALIKELVEVHTKEDAIVLDPFAGSGTTGVACVELNRNFIGMEIDEKFHKVALDRINEAMDKYIKEVS